MVAEEEAPQVDGGARGQVLLIGINYSPEETGIGPYTAELAEHLVRSGWGVTVLTGVPHLPEWRVRSGYRSRLRSEERRNGVVVRRFRHYVPSRQSPLRRALYEGTFFVQALTAMGVPRPDRTVGVVPSLSGGVVAALAAVRYRVPFGLVVQDVVSLAAAQSGLPGGAAVEGPLRAVEGWVARRAAAVSVITETFVPYLQSAGVSRDRIIHVPNWSRVSAPSRRASEIRAALGWDDDTTVVLHAGNMGYKQALDNVVEAARLAAQTRTPIRFVLLGHGSERVRLEAAGADLSTLEFLEPKPESMFMDVLAAADVLLLNERASVREMSLPSKLTSYFFAGRPVLAAIPEAGSTARELARSEGALLVAAEDPHALVDGVCRLRDDEELRRRLVARGRRYAETHLDRRQLLDRAEHFVSSLERSRRA